MNLDSQSGKKTFPRNPNVEVYMEVLVLYLPRWTVSAKTMAPRAAVMIMQRGLKAVTKTGPRSLLTTPCT